MGSVPFALKQSNKVFQITTFVVYITLSKTVVVEFNDFYGQICKFYVTKFAQIHQKS